MTGALTTMKRPQIEKWIEDHGGSISSVKKVDGMHLVCNEASSSSKYQKALKLEIPIITEVDLFALV